MMNKKGGKRAGSEGAGGEGAGREGAGHSLLNATVSGEDSIDEAKVMLDRCENWVNRWETSFPIPNTEISNMRTDLRRLRKSINAINKQENSKNELTSQIKTLVRRLEKIEFENVKLTSEIEVLQTSVTTLQAEVKSLNALFVAFDLSSLFRKYCLKTYTTTLSWEDIISEFATFADDYENERMLEEEYNQRKLRFDEEYTSTLGIPLSSIIEIGRKRHEIAPSGSMKTIKRQKDFLVLCDKLTSEEFGEVGSEFELFRSMLTILKATELHGF